MPNEVNTVLPDWEKLHRLVPSHFPPIDLFENVASPDELEIVFAIESITNERVEAISEALDFFPHHLCQYMETFENDIDMLQVANQF